MRSLEEIARRLIWWSPPEVALKNKTRFIAQVMIYGDLEDTKTLWKKFNRQELLSVLKNPPPGVFTPHAWHYWHLMLDQKTPPLPTRNLS
jgi:hypothetical protein